MLTRALRFFLALTLLLSVPASALEFKEHRWGFDGKIVPGRFNLLSVLVYEPGPRAFDGEIVLNETRGLGAVIGAPLTQPVYVTPGTSRWVQFLPFVAAEYEWQLRWGKGDKQKATIDGPSAGPPATVALLDPTSPFANETRIRGFAEDLFPTSVAATDGLDQLVLDHAPRWDAPRREAFLDWLRRGGIVHLTRGASGLPVFDGDLAPLNTTLTRERVGAGLVVRHDILRAECSADYLAKSGFAPRTEVKDQDQGGGGGTMLYNFDQNVLKGLAALTKPEVAWWLLYLLTIAYLVIIGPVHYKWSRTVDFKVAIGGFLGTIVVFALAFIIAGRRGSGEVQTVHSIAVARALPGGRWDTQQWISAFATSGDYYHFAHGSPVNFYSASNDVEAVNGKIYGGKDGRFDVDIPLYSSRPFLHRGILPGPDLSVQVVEWQANRLSLQPGSGFPKDPKEVWAHRGDLFLPLHRDGNLWVWSNGPMKDLDGFLEEGKSGQFVPYDWSERFFKPEELMRPLVANFLSEKRVPHRFTTRPLASNQLQLFVFTKSPETFAMKGKGFKGETGWALLIQDVFRGEPAPQ